MILPTGGNGGGRPERKPQFRTGQLVRHRRYGYRGVVVGFDLTCQADETWYYRNQTQPPRNQPWYHRNQTQPPRNQPWYHVLVDGSTAITYAAQTSLKADVTEEPVAHPLVEHLFSSFEEGRYVRNDTPWPA